MADLSAPLTAQELLISKLAHERDTLKRELAEAWLHIRKLERDEERLDFLELNQGDVLLLSFIHSAVVTIGDRHWSAPTIRQGIDGAIRERKESAS